MLVTEKGDELYYDFTNIQSTPLETSGVDIGNIEPGVLQNYNLGKLMRIGGILQLPFLSTFILFVVIKVKRVVYNLSPAVWFRESLGFSNKIMFIFLFIYIHMF